MNKPVITRNDENHNQRLKAKPSLTQGPVGPLLFRLTVPMMWGIFSIFTFNLIDTMFIGRLGTTELAAISFTFPVVMVVTNLAIGLGIGTSSVVARAIGEHDHRKIQNLATSSLVLSLIIVAVVVVAGLSCIKPVFSLLGAQPQHLILIEDYMTVWYVGMMFLVVPMVGNYIIRATGDMLFPGLIMGLSSIINLILDPILIFGWFGFPRLELKGAAMATVIAWFVSFCASSSILYFREKFIGFYWPKRYEMFAAWREIAAVAVPAASTHMIIPVGMAVIMNLLSDFGEEVVAAFGATARIETFSFIVVMALSAIIGPFTGQNYGAGRVDRILYGMNLSYKFSLFFGLFVAITLALGGRFLMGFFSDHPQVIHYGSMYLWMVPLGYSAHGAIYVASGIFNGSGHPLPAALVSIIRMFGLCIPMAFLLSYIFGVYGVYTALLIANLIMGVVAVVWSRRLMRSKQADMEKIL